jgi:hypothetical protein
MTRAQATAVARSVNLAPADVPEMAASGREEEAKVKNVALEGAHCAGAVSPYRRIVDMHSVKFKGASTAPRESLRSAVTIWPSAALAEQESTAMLSPRGRACDQHLLERLALGEIGPVHVSHVSVTRLPSPLPAAHDSYAARISMTISGSLGTGARSGRSTATLESSSPTTARISIPVYIDTFGFVAGPAQIGLTATGLKRPPSPATERRLLSKLYSRAKARGL